MATRGSAKRKPKATQRRSRRSTARARGNGSGEQADVDAIELLKSDHREVERLFKQFKDTNSKDRQQTIAAQICDALRTHAAIEEEIFYPAFLEATDETDIHHEAEIEHEGVKHLIEEIETAGVGDDHFEARVSVLSEMVRHHVEEEEGRGGMFKKAAKSDMDLDALGAELKRRKEELMAEARDDMDGTARSMRQVPMLRRRRQGQREARAK